MFRALVIPSLISRCACGAVRNYRRAGNRRPRDLAGIRIQHGIFRDIEELEEDPERTYEADFNQLHISHREHERELASKKELNKYHVIKNKYFKEKKMPNFLTWVEKEQIRELNKSDPQEWTPERLSESFPAVEEVIIKVLKTKWTPESMQRVKRHDESVRRNWELFKANEIKDLDPDVCKHLKKFSDRNFDSMQNAYAQIEGDPFQFKCPKPKNKEFLHIITSCKRNDKSKATIGQKETKQIADNGESSLAIQEHDANELKISKRQRRKTLTFNELVKNKPIDDAMNNEEMHLKVSLPEQEKTLVKVDNKPSVHLMEHTSNDDNELAVDDKSNEIETVDLTLVDANTTSEIIQKYPTKLGIMKSDNLPSIRHKIHIPPKLRRKGSVYKLYDCFYDDRGLFMYRVPGLAN